MQRKETGTSCLTRLAQPFVRFRECARGVAAVEFGLLIPVLLLFWLGSNEFGQALMIDRRVTTTTSAVADLIAQTDQLTEAQLDEILELSDDLMSTAMMSLYKPANFKMTVLNVRKESNGDLTVLWARDKTGSGAGPSQSFSPGPVTAAQIGSGFDPAVILTSSTQIIAKAEYDYTPSVGRIIKRDFGGTIKLEEMFFLAPRKGKVDVIP